MSQFNFLDFALLAILAASVVASVIRGFSREVAGLVALVVGVLLGMWFHGSVAAVIQQYISTPQVADMAGFGIIFLGIIVLGGIVGSMVSKVLQVTGLSLFDRLAGAAFGALKGALFGAIVVFALLAFSPGAPPAAVKASKIAPYVLWSADLLAAIAPREIKDSVVSNIASIQSLWNEHAPDLPDLASDSPGSKKPQKPSSSN